MKTLILTGLLILSGCGPERVLEVCDVQTPAGRLVTTVPRDCGCLVEQGRSARALLESGGWIPAGHVFAVTVRVLPVTSLESDRLVFGRTILGGSEVLLVHTADSWAHELVHVYRLQAGVPSGDEVAHLNWPQELIAALERHSADVEKNRCD